MGLGAYPEVSLAAARQAAMRTRGSIPTHVPDTGAVPNFGDSGLAASSADASDIVSVHEDRHLSADWDARLDEVMTALALLSERVERQQTAIHVEVTRQVLSAPRQRISMLPGP